MTHEKHLTETSTNNLIDTVKQESLFDVDNYLNVTYTLQDSRESDILERSMIEEIEIKEEDTIAGDASVEVVHSQVKRLRYDQCDLKFRNNIKNDFKCVLCEFATKNEFELKEHVRRVHSKKKLKCGVCDYATLSKIRLENHIRLVHFNKRMLECLQCNFKTHQTETMTDHLIEVHRKRYSFVCQICERSFDRISSLEVHKELMHGIGADFACLKCNFFCKDRVVFDKHMYTVHMIERCKVCDFKSKWKYDVKQHLEQKILCSHCSYETAHRAQLREHIRSVHFENGKLKLKHSNSGEELTRIEKIEFKCEKLEVMNDHSGKDFKSDTVKTEYVDIKMEKEGSL